eukprot:2615566-Amphidinium_carterae.1
MAAVTRSELHEELLVALQDIHADMSLRYHVQETLKSILQFLMLVVWRQKRLEELRIELTGEGAT